MDRAKARNMLRDGAVSWQARFLFMGLCADATKGGRVVLVTQRDWAAEYHVPAHMLKKALVELEECGWLKVERGHNQRDAVVEVDLSIIERDSLRTDYGLTTESLRTDYGVTTVGNSTHSQGKEAHKEQGTKNTEQGTQKTEHLARFEAFWERYPRKVGKAAAKKAYLTAAKKVGPDAINEGLRRQLPAWKEQEVKFIPHATTWIHGERWADEDSKHVAEQPAKKVNTDLTGSSYAVDEATGEKYLV